MAISQSQRTDIQDIRVREDTACPGRFTWVILDEGGRVVEAGVPSFPSQDEALIDAAGYRVDEDPDQPGLFLWSVQDESGRTIEGSDESFASRDEAILDAARAVRSLL